MKVLLSVLIMFTMLQSISAQENSTEEGLSLYCFNGRSSMWVSVNGNTGEAGVRLQLINSYPITDVYLDGESTNDSQFYKIKLEPGDFALVDLKKMEVNLVWSYLTNHNGHMIFKCY